MSDGTDQAKSIFLAAIEHAPERWPAFLEQACAGDVPLRAEVERLLRACSELGSFHEAQGSRLVATAQEPVTERPGTVIGPYKLMEQIGEGGMGLVFVAAQQEPVRRKVALKVIKPGMDSRQVIARFEAERQALALMDHPHIAQVHDGGTTPAGRPYFVMELVKGVPITDYCDQNQVPVRQRLELFLHVCEAVQHAHQKGIIHRDVKPSNVLVASHDGRPVPKVIDFGVAKAIGPQLTDKTIYTQLSQLVGTPLYMSPEQAGASSLDVDTRSDIYSLGVLLYELLTGTTPFDKTRLKDASYDEIRRIIREEEPPRPSTRLAESKDTLPSISAQRHTEPAKLTKLVRGELDWIVMKALEKDRNRRYETASAFAADVQRYLNDEPVLACPPSLSYRLRKFARRNKTALAMATLLLLAIVAVASTLGWTARESALRRAIVEGKIRQALDDALAAYDADKLLDAVAATRRAEALLASDNAIGDAVREELARWQSELAILQRLEDLDPRPAGSAPRRLADAAYARVFLDIDIDIDGLPAKEAGRRIRSHLVWRRLTEALDAWGYVRHEIGAFDQRTAPEAGRKRQQVFQVARAADPDELRSQARLAVETQDAKAAERLAALPEVNRLPADALRNLAMYIYYGGTQAHRERAVALLQNALVQRPGDFRLNYACAVYHERMQPPRSAEAAHYYSIAVALRPEHYYTRNHLAQALLDQRKWDRAIAEFRAALQLKKDYHEAHNNLGHALVKNGQLDEGIAEYREAIRLKKDDSGAHNNLGAALTDQGKVEEAINEYRQAIALDQKVAAPHNNLGNVFYQRRKFDEAITEYHKAIELDPKSAPAYNGLGNVLRDQKKLPDATTAYHKAIEIDTRFADAYNGLGNALLNQKKLHEAIEAFNKAIELDPSYAVAHMNLGNALSVKKDLEGAIREYRAAIALKRDFAEAHCNLGGALRQKGEFRLALDENRRGHELASKQPLWPYPSAKWVREAEQLVALDAKLPKVLKGVAQVADSDEQLALAILCHEHKKLYGAAVRFYEEAFAAEPKLIAPNRYNAACVAALAGCGKGKDADSLDEKERSRLRRQALDWLRADLEANRLVLEKGGKEAGPTVAGNMRHWLADADFAGVRDFVALAELPQTERQPSQKLWNDVADMLKRAQQKAGPEKKEAA
jgi:serine/threonine protein kinase/Tfp pilus assembly protein PilF